MILKTLGLRRNEVLHLHWDRGDRLHIQFERDGRPLLFIPRELDKTCKKRLPPLAPEFARMSMAVPKGDRRGPIFTLPMRRHFDEPMDITVRKIIAKISHKACVVVNDREKQLQPMIFADHSLSAGLDY